MPQDPGSNRFNLSNGWPILLLVGVVLIIFMTVKTQNNPSNESLSQSESTTNETTDRQNSDTTTASLTGETGGTQDPGNLMNGAANSAENAQLSHLIPSEKLAESKKPFTIQVYSVQDKPSAQKAVDGLRKAGHPAYFFSKDLKDKGIWFRVCVGRFDTKEEADQYLLTFKNLHKDSFIITTDISHLRDTIKSFSN